MSYLSDHNASVIANRDDDPPDEDYCDNEDCAAVTEARLNALREVREMVEKHYRDTCKPSTEDRLMDILDAIDALIRKEEGE